MTRSERWAGDVAKMDPSGSSRRRDNICDESCEQIYDDSAPDPTNEALSASMTDRRPPAFAAHDSSRSGLFPCSRPKIPAETGSRAALQQALRQECLTDECTQRRRQRRRLGRSHASEAETRPWQLQNDEWQLQFRGSRSVVRGSDDGLGFRSYGIGTQDGNADMAAAGWQCQT